MRILVTGANGQLGMSLRRLAGQEGKAHHWIFTDVVDGPDTLRLDITDREAVRALVAREQVEALVNCAAYTDVEGAEDHEALAELLNATAVGILAEAMRDRDGLLVHISTDYVFGKEPYNTPCREDRKGTPTGVYGRTKLHGEEAILRSGVRHVILRTAWLYSEFGRNFVKTMLKLTAEKPVLQVVFDQAGTPTYAGDLAEAILRVLERPVPGIYNYSNEGVCSWFDFSRMIAAYAGHTACDIRPCHSDEFPSKVHRPAYSVLDKTKIKETYALSIPYWTDSLRRCVDLLMGR